MNEIVITGITFLLCALGIALLASVAGILIKNFFMYNEQKKGGFVSLIYAVIIFFGAYYKLIVMDIVIMSIAPLLLILIPYKKYEIFLSFPFFFLGVWASGGSIITSVFLALDIFIIHVIIKDRPIALFIQICTVIPIAFSESILSFKGDPYIGRIIWSMGIFLMAVSMMTGLLLIVNRKGRFSAYFMQYVDMLLLMFTNMSCYYFNVQGGKIYFSRATEEIYEMQGNILSKSEWVAFMRESFKKDFDADATGIQEGFFMTPFLGNVKYIHHGQYKIWNGDKIGFLRETTNEISRDEMLYFKTQKNSLTRFPTNKVFSTYLFENTQKIEDSSPKGFLLAVVEIDTHTSGYSVYDLELEVKIQRALLLKARSVFENMEIFSIIFGEYIIMLPFDGEMRTVEILKRKLEETLDEGIDIDGRFSSGFSRLGFREVYAGDIQSYDDATRVSDELLYCLTVLKKDKLLTHYQFKDYEYKEYIEKKRRVRHLNNIIKNKKLNIVYQPIIEMQTLKPLYFEVLSRIKHEAYPDPKIFFDDVIEFSLTPQVDQIIFSLFKDALEKGDIPPYNYSVNISANTKMDKNIRDVADYLYGKGFNLYIELVERNRYSKIHVEERELFAKKHHAILVADGYGTNYSNMELLDQFDFSAVKIPRAFVVDIDINKKNRFFVSLIYKQCMQFGLDCIAEGVERREEADTLKEIGIRYIQGYLYAKPEKTINRSLIER